MACNSASCSRTVALVAPTQEKCDAAGTPSAKISLTAAKVPSCVEPPAPKVTEQNSGLCAYSAARVARSLAAPSGVLGGKNSKLIGSVFVITRLSIFALLVALLGSVFLFALFAARRAGLARMRGFAVFVHGV